MSNIVFENVIFLFFICTGTISVSLTPCSIPGKPVNFTIPENMIEFGLGKAWYFFTDSQKTRGIRKQGLFLTRKLEKFRKFFIYSFIYLFIYFLKKEEKCSIEPNVIEILSKLLYERFSQLCKNFSRIY